MDCYAEDNKFIFLQTFTLFYS